MQSHSPAGGDPMTIPINDLKRQTILLSECLQTAVRTVVESGWFILGKQVEAFEKEFAGYCGAAHSVATANGTDALELALRALRIGPGDLVATVANAGGYSTAAILATGAEPLYVDIDAGTMLMDPSALRGAMHSRVRAVIVTHLYGRLADMAALRAAAGTAPLVEDCAQAHGARRDGRHAGTWGALGCFSFYPTKNLGALGDAGAVITNDSGLVASVRRLRQYGWTSRYHSGMPGGRNSRMDEIQAAVLRAKLPHLDSWNLRRRAIARLYGTLLARTELVLPQLTGEHFVVHQYVVRSSRRGLLRESLAAAGIGTDIHYPVPDYRQESAAGARWADCSLPVTERSCREVFSLPCFPELTDEEIQTVAAALLHLHKISL